MSLPRALPLVACLLTCAAARGADWPQYRGPGRDDVSAETGLLQAWPAGGPKLLWTYRDAGIGYSGPAIVGDLYYTLGGRGDREFLIALDIKAVSAGTVSQAWATDVGPLFQWDGNKWSAGPSTTPTVDGELIFTLGGMGDLLCAATATGEPRWRKNLPKELESQVNPIGGGPKNLGWGYTGSPLVDGERLILAVGGPKGTLAALNKHTGDVLWRSTELTDQAAYTSPIAADFGGVRQYVVLTNQGLSGVAAADGRLLWRSPRRYGTEVVNSPLISGDYVYTTVGSAQGCDLVKIEKDGDKFQATPVYNNQNLANHHGNVVLVDQHIFGHSQNKGWICQNLRTGEAVWSERMKLRAGALTYADGRLVLFSEDNGTVAQIEASTAGWRETGRFPIPEQTKLRKPNGRIWTPPVISGGRLFLRDQELVFCYNLKGE
ncbi:MAG: PQQ-binding-like beta-propeller repeat protein [Pirellulaceae bacterium]|nr:PQQ-binding-like beta-propeller repeat protein [Pirellulaceae bacterium]